MIWANVEQIIACNKRLVYLILMCKQSSNITKTNKKKDTQEFPENITNRHAETVLTTP